MYADDLVLAIQCEDFETGEIILQNDLKTINDYYISWRLKLNLNKTEVSAFHLNNTLANRRPEIHLNGILLNYNPHPKYLGVTMDRSLSYKEHLKRLALKIRSRNNLVQKLVGTNWDSSVGTLRISALS